MLMVMAVMLQTNAHCFKGSCDAVGCQSGLMKRAILMPKFEAASCSFAKGSSVI